MVLLHSQTKPTSRTAPDFDLLGVDGKHYTLADFANHTGLAVIFTCNHCPYAVASRPIIIDLSDHYPDIAIVCISSNDAAYVPEDSYEKMQALSEVMDFGFPYLYDADQSVAQAYDAQCTPDNYLFKKTKNTDTSFELFFHGRFNDNRQDPSRVTHKDFEEHIIKLLAGQKPSEIQPPSMGCSIKWK